jgi:hypothetical protein
MRITFDAIIYLSFVVLLVDIIVTLVVREINEKRRR